MLFILAAVFLTMIAGAIAAVMTSVCLKEKKYVRLILTYIVLFAASAIITTSVI